MLSIRKMIRDNGLKPGDVIPAETALSTEFGVSRTVAREALRGLAALRIIEVGNGRRARVAGPTAEALSTIIDHIVHTEQVSVMQIADARRTIEMRAVSLAALHRSEADAQQLLKTIEGMYAAVEADESERVMELDILFHEIIARASGNPLYSIFIDSFRIITRQTWAIGWRARGNLDAWRDNIKCHERVAQAVVAQDQNEAERAMSEHFDSSVMVLLRAGIK
ncbi:FadR/GntR family transcriptional regulator [Tropicimonas sp. TH_r6]|uniref:FadR/GntR family transcriptional regulator n=1 Tax=Tropicimonas sp. TH_r6 TaxID=3082085 RepID=UPI002953074F|nr:FadR/GntR family transcriptional regulator [Tropicimonas sp. TH_r6]MDV7141108.1 FadR/GntR family transcriptional regulator [Tropicimonas sp. TH_r6]